MPMPLITRGEPFTLRKSPRGWAWNAVIMAAFILIVFLIYATR
jgi:hypothetical protein